MCAVTAVTGIRFRGGAPASLWVNPWRHRWINPFACTPAELGQLQALTQPSAGRARFMGVYVYSQLMADFVHGLHVQPNKSPCAKAYMQVCGGGGGVERVCVCGCQSVKHDAGGRLLLTCHTVWSNTP